MRFGAKGFASFRMVDAPQAEPRKRIVGVGELGAAWLAVPEHTRIEVASHDCRHTLASIHLREEVRIALDGLSRRGGIRTNSLSFAVECPDREKVQSYRKKNADRQKP